MLKSNKPCINSPFPFSVSWRPPQQRFQGQPGISGLDKFHKQPVIDSQPLSEEQQVTRLHAFIEEEKNRKDSLIIDYQPESIPRIIKAARKVYSNTEKKPFIIGIAGYSAAGKTTFTKRIAQHLKELFSTQTDTIKNLSLDRYFKDFSTEVIRLGGYLPFLRSDFGRTDRPEAFHESRITDDLKSINAGRTIYPPHFDFMTLKVTEPELPLKPGKVFLTEVLHILRDTYSPFIDLKVFLETHPTVIEKRWFDRAHTGERTYGNELFAQKNFQAVMREAEKHIEPTKKNADIILNGERSLEEYDAFLDRLTKQLRAIGLAPSVVKTAKADNPYPLQLDPTELSKEAKPEKDGPNGLSRFWSKLGRLFNKRETTSASTQ